MDDRAPTGRGEVWLNVVAGLNVLVWAALGLRHSWIESGEVGVVRVFGSVIHLVAGGLFLFRRPLQADGSWAQLLTALPVFIVGGLAFRWSPEPERWPLIAVAVFVVGAVITIAALLTLGRSFAVLPARREVVVHGLYRFVRHPAYAGELVLVIAMVLATMQWYSYAALAAFLPAMALRLNAEEQVMGGSPDYRAYAETVRWRLLPGVW